MFNPETLFKQLEKRGYEVKKLTPYQYRVECVLDFYTGRYRWNNIATGKRGGWMDFSGVDVIVKFIDEQVALADAILDKAIADGTFVDPDVEHTDEGYSVDRSGPKRYLKAGDAPWWARTGAQ